MQLRKRSLRSPYSWWSWCMGSTKEENDGNKCKVSRVQAAGSSFWRFRAHSWRYRWWNLNKQQLHSRTWRGYEASVSVLWNVKQQCWWSMEPSKITRFKTLTGPATGLCARVVYVLLLLFVLCLCMAFNIKSLTFNKTVHNFSLNIRATTSISVWACCTVNNCWDAVKISN